ncbi:MAG: hypothetical protein GXP45_04820 [bacterium]|nr:hypothetical protein [bacterium]
MTEAQIDGSGNVLFNPGSANYSNYQNVLSAIVQVENQLDSIKSTLIGDGVIHG